MRNRKPKRPVKSRRLAAKRAKPICTGYWADQRGWSDYVKNCVEQYRWSRRLPLNHHDWDDIKQACLIRAWEKRKTFNEERGSFLSWLKTLALNQTRNEVRSRFSFGPRTCSRFRRRFLYPQSIHTKTVTTVLGEEEIRYEPDAVDPRTCLVELPTREELIAELDKTETRHFKVIERKMPNPGSVHYSQTWLARKQIQAKWKKLLDQIEPKIKALTVKREVITTYNQLVENQENVMAALPKLKGKISRTDYFALRHHAETFLKVLRKQTA